MSSVMWNVAICLMWPAGSRWLIELPCITLLTSALSVQCAALVVGLHANDRYMNMPKEGCVVAGGRGDDAMFNEDDDTSTILKSCGGRWCGVIARESARSVIGRVFVMKELHKSG